MKVIILTIVLLVFTFSACASVTPEFGYNNLDGPILKPAINYSELPTINSTEWWNTVTLGPLNDVSSVQFDNIGGTLTFDTSWLESFGSTIWCSLGGCTMEGNINMGGNNITNASNIEATYFVGDGSGLTNVPGTNDTIYTIYFDTSKKSVITYNLTDSDASIITVNTVPGQKEIYGGDFE